jgi:hypothetical protein
MSEHLVDGTSSWAVDPVRSFCRNPISIACRSWPAMCGGARSRSLSHILCSCPPRNWPLGMEPTTYITACISHVYCILHILTTELNIIFGLLNWGVSCMLVFYFLSYVDL